MSIFESLVGFVFGKTSGIVQDVRHGEEEEAILEQEETREEADTATEVAVAGEEENEIGRLEEDEAAIDTILSRGALTRNELPALHSILRDLRSTAAAIDKNIVAMSNALDDNKQQVATSIAIVKDEMRDVQLIRKEAAQYVDAHIRDGITGSADRLTATYAGTLRLLQSEAMEDRDLEQALSMQRQAEQQLHNAIGALSGYIETGDTQHSRTFNKTSETVTAALRQSTALLRQHNLSVLKTEERLEKLKRTIDGQWITLDNAIAGAKRAA